MKCPNCGGEMADDSLYCEKCGEDIHIVPDFEPEIEYNMEQTLKGIKEDVLKEGDKTYQNNITYEEKDGKKEPAAKKPSGRKWFFIGGGLVIILIAAITGGVLLYQYHSYDYQLMKAVESMAQNRYERAIKYYDRVMELDPDNAENQFSLAEAYNLKGNKIQYEYVLRGIIKNDKASDEQLEKAYGKLITIYREKGDYKTIYEIIMDSSSESIKFLYQEYTAPVPEFSFQTGYYEEILPLKLSAGTAGTIFFTQDGSEPGDSSQIYTAPIFLDDGTHMIKAYFVNEYGISSECITMTYHIDIEQAVAPEISVVSGEYYTPMVIRVENADEGNIYFTTDGSDPTQNSTLYTRPINMPLGSSVYKFAHVNEDGSVGNIAERKYNLVLNTDLTPEDAEATIIAYMLSTGKIYQADGTYSTESKAKYLYRYIYTANINQDSDYYVVAEIFQAADGVKDKTGNFFAVNVYDGTYKKLQVDDKGKYTLVEIINEAQEG